MEQQMLYTVAASVIIAAMILYVIFYLLHKKRKESATDTLGKSGELAVASRLKKIAARYGWIVKNNVYLPLYDKTTQIDHLLIGDFGVLVIETKHISGVLYGDERQDYWKQEIGSKHNRVYNPLMQNKAHTDCLTHHLRKAGLKNVLVSGLVVFSAKDIYLNIPKNLPVITLDRLDAFLKQSSFHARSNANPVEISKVIDAVRVTDSAVIRKHNRQVHQMASNRNRGK
jgi:hypothetical protein